MYKSHVFANSACKSSRAFNRTVSKTVNSKPRLKRHRLYACNDIPLITILLPRSRLSTHKSLHSACERMVKVVDFKPLAPHCYGSNSDRDFGFFHVRKLSGWLTERRWLTQLLICAWNNELKAHEVFLHQLNWNMSVWLKT
jgi:hypothetical protein